jgi:hypothetical protein
VVYVEEYCVDAENGQWVLSRRRWLYFGCDVSNGQPGAMRKDVKVEPVPRYVWAPV